jgi:hypothetical protein
MCQAQEASVRNIYPVLLVLAVLAVCASHGRVHLIGVYLTGVHLTDVHLIGVYLMDIYLMDVYLMDVCSRSPILLTVIDLSKSDLQNTSFCASCGWFLLPAAH